MIMQIILLDDHECVAEISRLVAKINGKNSNFTLQEIGMWFEVNKVLFSGIYGNVEYTLSKGGKEFAVITKREGAFVKTIIELNYKS